MLASLAALPVSLASSSASFLARKRKTFAWTAGVVGGAYYAGKWALDKVGEKADEARREGWGRDDLARRFNLNLQDSQFTVLALLPTLATQLHDEMDVEARTTELAERAREEREKRAREAREEAERRERKREEEERKVREEEERVAREKEREWEKALEAGDKAKPEEEEGEASSSSPAATTGEEAHIPAQPAAPDSLGSSSATTDPSLVLSLTSTLNPTATPFSFNPAAPAFEPNGTSSVSSSSASVDAEASVEPSTATTEGFLGEADEKPDEEEGEKAEELQQGGQMEKKSWAALVKDGAPKENEESPLVGIVEKPITPPVDPDTPPQTAPPSVSSASPACPINGTNPAPPASSAEIVDNAVVITNGVTAAEETEEEKVDEGERNPLALKSKVELWNEIKILSFTRLLTSLYLIVLLTLQTHVQLALLGRSSYVSSLLSSLPPRTPSPPPSKPLSLPSYLTSLTSPSRDENSDEDLEKALYDPQKLPLTREELTEEKRRREEEERKDVERKYLTFSWWLLHEGWKAVEERVRGAVEEVVGGMGLRSPLVYGELGALFAQLRRKIEIDDVTGKPFDFSAALHPPNPSQELQTLISGGSYVPPPPSSSSSSSSRSSYPPPTCASDPDPISPSLRRLLNETSDALDSPDAALVRSFCLDRLFSLAMEKLEPAFRSGGAGEGDGRGARFEDVTERTARLAGLLPILTRLTGKEAEGGVLGRELEGNDWVEALEDVRELREFSAVLYGSWDRDDVRRGCV
ncbi:hypothetical protein JCM8547_002003 [Rhodosporidiobolus lusitaniae]